MNQQDEIEFTKRMHTVDAFLSQLHSVRTLLCDEDLEAYILEHRPTKNFLPQLVELNNVSVKVTD